MAVVRDVRPDRWRALGVSSIVGSLVGAFGIALGDRLARGTDLIASLPLFLISAMLSFPVWALGIGLMGLPVQAVLDRLGFGGPIVSILIGFVLAGTIWSVMSWPDMAGLGSADWWSSTSIALTGFFAGAVAGYSGWKAAQPSPIP